MDDDTSLDFDTIHGIFYGLPWEQGAQDVGHHVGPMFKEHENIQNFMGNVRVVKIVVEYDVKMVCPLLL